MNKKEFRRQIYAEPAKRDISLIMQKYGRQDTRVLRVSSCIQANVTNTYTCVRMCE